LYSTPAGKCCAQAAVGDAAKLNRMAYGVAAGHWALAVHTLGAGRAEVVAENGDGAAITIPKSPAQTTPVEDLNAGNDK
jgi:hypothetical protein